MICFFFFSCRIKSWNYCSNLSRKRIKEIICLD